jgi:hypothetical protein
MKRIRESASVDRVAGTKHPQHFNNPIKEKDYL